MLTAVIKQIWNTTTQGALSGNNQDSIMHAAVPTSNAIHMEVSGFLMRYADAIPIPKQ